MSYLPTEVFFNFRDLFAFFFFFFCITKCLGTLANCFNRSTSLNRSFDFKGVNS